MSKDHHFTLLFCWKIRNGLKKKASADRIIKYVAYFWKTHMQPHFHAEEAVLFSLAKDAMVHRAINEHQQIALQINKLKAGDFDAPTQLNVLADLVDDHVRYEERELFPHLEKTLDAAQLNNIELQLEALHNTVLKDEFEDEFWMQS